MPEGEAVREALNDWIKTGGAFDGVVDFAPGMPINPILNLSTLVTTCNDKLHPNDAGYQAMANVIDLGPFK